MKRTVIAAVLGVLLCLASVSAGVISGNFCSVANIVDYPAGVVPVGAWNDYTGPAGFGAAATVTSGAGEIMYADGSLVASGMALNWDVSPSGSQNTNDSVDRPTGSTLGADIDDGHDQMMAGYLQISRMSNAVPILEFSGTGINVAADSYDLILYLDGDADVQPDSSTANNQYSVGIWTDPTKLTSLGSMVFGRDAGTYALANDGTNPLGEYIQVTSTIDGSPTEGNYVRFSGLTSNSFYIEIEGVLGGTDGLSNDGGHGVALNGFQIVPEPMTIGLLGFGALLIGRRK